MSVEFALDIRYVANSEELPIQPEELTLLHPVLAELLVELNAMLAAESQD